ncbi:hypothetical protein [Miltoncostaea oceani]|uniref:hypothetical protein n=1 Tax=Miltoncostaea oceani TaxID=2843216 RepID=UPI001C3CDA55|nr:hypothetical protein [Miltoncostaea oceani]
MSDDDLERRIRRSVRGVEPSDEVIARVRRTAVRAAELARPAARQFRSRRAILSYALAGAVLTGGGATAAVMLSGSSGATVPVSPEAEAALRESVVGRAAWLQPGYRGSPLVQVVPRLPALRFPEGTTYAQALRGLVASVGRDGTMPRGARLAPPLPRGAVWAPSRTGPRLDLTAPFGYGLPRGNIREPDFRISGSLTARQAERLARAFIEGRLTPRQARAIRLGVPRLPACQVLPRRAACDLAPPPEQGPAPVTGAKD